MRDRRPETRVEKGFLSPSQVLDRGPCTGKILGVSTATRTGIWEEGQARAGHLCSNVVDYDSVTLSLMLGLDPYILVSQCEQNSLAAAPRASASEPRSESRSRPLEVLRGSLGMRLT